ncbi:M56 family metallopeptidase [Phenylobacterium sp.]|jgi:beta-lactamase regulating signal transducer with metallopeptidase domain|uniref:M56 family metallopeptidase n=1 Tax=Phenylobacterium sp. TaxID=1871053 RepID=UPI002F40E253
MANEVLIVLIHFNLAAAAATLAVLLARRPIRERFGAEVAYRLWIGVPIAALAALMPPAQATRIVPPGLGPHFDPIWTASQDLAHAPAGTLLALWLAGAVIAILILAACQMRFLAAARRGVAGPAVAGVVAPRVIMPADAEALFTPEERTLIRAHERTHIDRGDPLTNGIIALAQCLFWFNPMAHLAARTARLDQELACDAQVLAHRAGQRRRYAETLLKTQLGGVAAPLGCHWLAGTASHPLEQRIQALRQPAPDFKRQDHGAIALLCALAIAAYGAWRAQPSAVAVGMAPDPTPPVETHHMQAIIIPPVRL